MNKKTIALTLLGLASAFALTTTNAKAVETTSNVNVTPGELTLESDNSISFNDYKLTGAFEPITTNASANFGLKVTDATGSRNGWNVQASHIGLTNGTEELVGATINLSDGGLTNPLSTDGVNLNGTISIGKSAVDISSAAKGSGMGIFEHDWTASKITLNIPEETAQNMLADQYTTTINWTLTAGPQVTETAPAE